MYHAIAGYRGQKHLLAVVVCTSLIGLGSCSKPAADVDTARFRAAVVDYLSANRMELKVKAIKSGPTINGQQAEMTASLTHAELSGPAVTWKIEFVREASGDWKVTKHMVL